MSNVLNLYISLSFNYFIITIFRGGTFFRIYFFYIYSLLFLFHVFSFNSFNSVVLFIFSQLSLALLYFLICFVIFDDDNNYLRVIMRIKSENICMDNDDMITDAQLMSFTSLSIKLP